MEGNIFAVGRLNLSIKSMTLTIAGPPHIFAGLEGHTTMTGIGLDIGNFCDFFS